MCIIIDGETLRMPPSRNLGGKDLLVDQTFPDPQASAHYLQRKRIYRCLSAIKRRQYPRCPTFDGRNIYRVTFTGGIFDTIGSGDATLLDQTVTNATNQHGDWGNFKEEDSATASKPNLGCRAERCHLQASGYRPEREGQPRWDNK